MAAIKSTDDKKRGKQRFSVAIGQPNTGKMYYLGKVVSSIANN